jgi:2-polyprenyl-6-methoxyphenol hydroxylase-like FAD-dependent oxidoreductase
MRVTDLKASGDGVEVCFEDSRTGKTASMAADLVIAADGVRSTVRKILQAPVVSEYSGFIAWRGTVPQSELREETARFFADGLVYDLMHRTYILWWELPSPLATLLCAMAPSDQSCLQLRDSYRRWCYRAREEAGELGLVYQRDPRLTRNARNLYRRRRQGSRQHLGPRHGL